MAHGGGVVGDVAKVATNKASLFSSPDPARHQSKIYRLWCSKNWVRKLKTCSLEVLFVPSRLFTGKSQFLDDMFPELNLINLFGFCASPTIFTWKKETALEVDRAWQLAAMRFFIFYIMDVPLNNPAIIMEHRGTEDQSISPQEPSSWELLGL
jgi:hypothetical protein